MCQPNDGHFAPPRRPYSRGAIGLGTVRIHLGPNRRVLGCFFHHHSVRPVASFSAALGDTRLPEADRATLPSPDRNVPRHDFNHTCRLDSEADLIGRHIYLTGEFDRTTLEVLLKFSRPEDVLLDIGANIGYVSAYFLHRVSRSKAVAIEPQPKIVDLLRSNLAPFGDERYKIFPVAFRMSTHLAG